MEKGQIDITKYDKLPTFIAVEGPIGAGKTTLTKLLADIPQGSVVIQADEKAQADAIIQVMDQSREAGVYAISLASEPKF